MPILFDCFMQMQGGFKNRLGIRGNNDQLNHSGLHSVCNTFLLSS